MKNDVSTGCQDDDNNGTDGFDDDGNGNDVGLSG